jgi:hypothetical protein
MELYPPKPCKFFRKKETKKNKSFPRKTFRTTIINHAQPTHEVCILADTFKFLQFFTSTYVARGISRLTKESQKLTSTVSAEGMFALFNEEQWDIPTNLA